MITKNDIQWVALDVTGSDYIHFILKDGVKVKRGAIGDGYWQGESEVAPGKCEFMVAESRKDEMMDRGEDESMYDFMEKDAVIFVDSILSSVQAL